MPEYFSEAFMIIHSVVTGVYISPCVFLGRKVNTILLKATDGF